MKVEYIKQLTSGINGDGEAFVYLRLVDETELKKFIEELSKIKSPGPYDIILKIVGIDFQPSHYGDYMNAHFYTNPICID